MKKAATLDTEALMTAVERVTKLDRGEFCNSKKTRSLVQAKEAIIVVGRDLGASNAGLARLLGLDASVVSRRYECGKARMSECQATRG